MKREFKKRGFFSLFGVVKPLRSLMVWKKTSPKTFKVSLPEGTQSVKVMLLAQFSELSWLHYATFGKYYVGGWAAKKLLFCVKQAYKIGSPDFNVHYLSHEAQHFSDYRSFPKLKSSDLEYRAKLAELALTASPIKFVGKLKREAKRAPQIPHSFAAYKILQGLTNSSSPAEIRKEAVQLLTRHTKTLKQRGANKVESVISES